MQNLGSTPDGLNQKLYFNTIKFPGDSCSQSSVRSTGLFCLFLKLSIIKRLWGFVSFCFSKTVFSIPGTCSCRGHGCRELGGRVFHPRPYGDPGLSSPSRAPAPGREAPLPAGQRTCHSGSGSAAVLAGTRAVAAGPGGAGRGGAPGGAGRWDAPRAGPAPARGRSGRRGVGAARTADGGRVLGAPRAANAAAALGPQRLSARNEPHPEKGLLQAGRQQDRLGAAQDLLVPNARRQRGLWRGVVRPLGLRARWGARGTPGASGRTDDGRPGSRTQVEPPDRTGPG